MQVYTILLLVCLAVLSAYAQPAPAPAYDAVHLADDYSAIHEAEQLPALERSPRTKRGLLLLKKKLLLGFLGLKAAKVGAVGVAGALALKKAKAASSHHSSGASLGSYSYSSSYPAWHVNVRSW